MKYIQLGAITRKPVLAFQIMNNRKGRIEYIDKSMAKELISLIDTLLGTKQITQAKHNYYKSRIILGLEESKDYRWIKNILDREKYKQDKYFNQKLNYDIDKILEDLFIEIEIKEEKMKKELETE